MVKKDIDSRLLDDRSGLQSSNLIFFVFFFERDVISLVFLNFPGA